MYLFCSKNLNFYNIIATKSKIYFRCVCIYLRQHKQTLQRMSETNHWQEGRVEGKNYVLRFMSQNIFTRKNHGRTKAITRHAIKKLQNGCPRQHPTTLGDELPSLSMNLLSFHSSINPFLLTPETFFAGSPHISHNLWFKKVVNSNKRQHLCSHLLGPLLKLVFIIQQKYNREQKNPRIMQWKVWGNQNHPMDRMQLLLHFRSMGTDRYIPIISNKKSFCG